MTTNHYPSPVDKLLTYGDARTLLEWPNYLELGLSLEHVPDLIRMAMDDDLFAADMDSLETWAPVHAWRALGQLRAQAAIESLVGLLRRIDQVDDEWIQDEIPKVLGMIGPAAIPALAAYLADPAHEMYARAAAARGLQQIAERQPDARAECVALLTRQLELFAEQDATFNAFLIDLLTDLAAVESALVMERAFASDSVDEFIRGDWEDVQIALGLKEAREHPREPGALQPLALTRGSQPRTDMARLLEDIDRQYPVSRKAKTKAKAKRKMAEKSKKKNRKKK